MPQLRPRSLRLLPALVPLALALAACGVGPFGSSGPADELRAARQEWLMQGIDSYRYTIHKSCGECMPESVAPARVEVRDGRTVSVAAATSARQIRPEFFQTYDTVEELFDAIEAVIESDPYRFSARYDPRRGYPISYSVDFDREYVDDEGGFTIADFEVIR